MRLKFVNDSYILEMDGNGETDTAVISVSGLGTVEKRYSTVKYVDFPGQVTVSEGVRAREIVIKGDIYLKGGMPLSEYHIFFSQGGTLHILKGNVKKRIDYLPVYFRTKEKNGDYMSFELSLICDRPYFKDSSNSELSIYKRIDKITGSFTLPAVFTQRLTEVDAVNKGQVPAEPVITLKCTREGQYKEGIEIVNYSKGAALKLPINLKENEVVKIDIENRRVSSNLRQSPFGILSNDTVMAEFLLKKGINHIALINKNQGELLDATIFFDNSYVEAV